jgi:hypothetical protein
MYLIQRLWPIFPDYYFHLFRIGSKNANHQTVVTEMRAKELVWIVMPE